MRNGGEGGVCILEAKMKKEQARQQGNKTWMGDYGKAGGRKSEGQMTIITRKNVHFSHPRSLRSTKEGGELPKATRQECAAEIRLVHRILGDSEIYEF